MLRPIIWLATVFAVPLIGAFSVTAKDTRPLSVDMSLERIAPAKQSGHRCFKLEGRNKQITSHIPGTQVYKKHQLKSMRFLLRPTRRKDYDAQYFYEFVLAGSFKDRKSQYFVDGYCDGTKLSGQPAGVPRKIECAVECDGGSMHLSGTSKRVHLTFLKSRGIRLKSCGGGVETYQKIVLRPQFVDEIISLAPVPLAQCKPLERYYFKATDKSHID